MIQLFAIYVLYGIMTEPALFVLTTVDTLAKLIVGLVVAIMVVDSAVKLFRLITQTPTTTVFLNKKVVH